MANARVRSAKAPGTSATAVEQQLCSNGYQRVTLNRAGGIISLTTTRRCFNRAQRRALAARDGGCVIPGCHTPAWACEAHHVPPWEHVQTTDVNGGVLLCWYHHRTIDTSGWHIRIHRGAPEVMPPPGLGPQKWTPVTKSPTRLTQRLKDRQRTGTPARASESGAAPP